MTYAYITICAISAVFIAADLVLRYNRGIKNFGMEKKLIRFEIKTIPLERFLPHTILMLLFFGLIFGVSGLILDYLGLRWYFSLPCSLLPAFLFCYFVQSPLLRLKNKIDDKAEPTGDAISGIEGYVTEFIPGDGYGQIQFEHNGETFKKNAISAYETDIPEYERVIIIMKEDDMCIVESITEVYRVFSEE